MKNIIIATVLLTATAAFAEGSGQTASASQQQSSTSTAANQGNNQTIVFEATKPVDTRGRDLTDTAIASINAQTARDVASTTQTIKNTPSIGLAALASSNDTCMGSVSAGGSGPGFSIGVGTTYKDDNCVMLKNSRELWNMGMKGAAMALMCNDKNNAEALELTGYICPQKKKAAEKQAAGTLGSGLPDSGTAGTQSAPIAHYSVQ